MENTWADHSRRERWCCGEGRSSFGDRKRAYLRSALKTSRRLFPAQDLRCGEGARYFRQRALGRKPERTAGNGTLPASREAEAQSNSREPIVPAGEERAQPEWRCHEMPGWRREELLRLLHDVGPQAPQLCSIFLPVRCWPARIADQSAVRAGAGGEPARSHGANHGNGTSGAHWTECEVQ
jgi:hypothetical protein